MLRIFQYFIQVALRNSTPFHTLQNPKSQELWSSSLVATCTRARSFSLSLRASRPPTRHVPQRVDAAVAAEVARHAAAATSVRRRRAPCQAGRAANVRPSTVACGLPAWEEAARDSLVCTHARAAATGTSRRTTSTRCCTRTSSSPSTSAGSSASPFAPVVPCMHFNSRVPILQQPQDVPRGCGRDLLPRRPRRCVASAAGSWWAVGSWTDNASLWMLLFNTQSRCRPARRASRRLASVCCTSSSSCASR